MEPLNTCTSFRILLEGWWFSAKHCRSQPCFNWGNLAEAAFFLAKRRWLACGRRFFTGLL